MKVKDHLAHLMREEAQPDYNDELLCLIDELNDLTGSELEAEVLVCPCGKLLPLLPPFDRVQNHIDFHESNKYIDAALRKQINDVLIGGMQGG